MPEIKLLPKNVAELIAAGEVVERPASVIKELVENSIDAGADTITIEIQRGGITYIRVTDNGCGISYKDVPTAFLRHATSKIRTDSDLDSISTLGFRGEALAAVSSVARVELLTSVKDSELGTHYIIEGGEETLYEESGCPTGTTIIIRDIFFNTPARMKFLKKDVSEANACAAVIDRIALSHPEVSFKFIRDGKLTLTTTGDSSIKSVIYSVLGRDFSASLIELNNSFGGIEVTGFTSKPVACKPTRNNQYTFLNGRLVKSGTVIAAVEQAYKNSAMVGKFPGFVIYIKLPFDTVDVNVHPAKTEVRFSDERRIFDAVYAAVKNAISNKDTRPEVKLNTPTFNRFENMTTEQFRQQSIAETVAEKIYKKPVGLHKTDNFDALTFKSKPETGFIEKYSYVAPSGEKTEPVTQNEYKEKYENAVSKVLPEKETTQKINNVIVEATKETVSVDIVKEIDEKPEIIIIGEAFTTYIIAQMGNSVFMIDKHAAHERILFNELKKNHSIEVQSLLTPVSVVLSKEEYNAVISNIDLLTSKGFEVEDFGNSTVVVRAIPAVLTREEVSSIISEVADGLLSSGNVQTEREENLFHTVACRAAIKAGTRSSLPEMQNLAEKVLTSQEIMYCPHGRPVAFEIKKRELEKQFGRIQ